MFGPSSLESEDNILQLDQTLAELFSFIDENVGLENTLIVLSADHGTPEVPGYLQELGIQAGFVEPKSWDKQPALAELKKQFDDWKLEMNKNRIYQLLRSLKSTIRYQRTVISSASEQH